MSVSRSRCGGSDNTMDFRKKFGVQPGTKFKLIDIDPAYKGDHESDQSAEFTLCFDEGYLEARERQTNSRANPAKRRHRAGVE